MGKSIHSFVGSELSFLKWHSFGWFPEVCLESQHRQINVCFVLETGIEVIPAQIRMQVFLLNLCVC